ncbi:exonuclease domain-containing protein [Aneurinibacillus sp. REN35]|uniref:exonuclease domain-containing protein n=1 Tax=Aneurinibacillus sp. REN35 TaxID=3237286 RepID=UPI0035272671
MKEQEGFLARISQLLSRGIGRQQLSMFYGQGSADLRQEAWTRSVWKESQQNAALLRTPLQQLTYASIDIETTGFHPAHGDEIISIAAVRMFGSTVSETEQFFTYVRPTCNIPIHITELTGIREEDVVNAPELAKAFCELENFLNSSIIVGYYIGHELSFFNHFLWRAGRRRFDRRLLEMKKVAECLFPANSVHTMEEMLIEAGIMVEGRHDALCDARMTALLWGSFQSRLQEVKVETVEELYEYMARSSGH